MRYILIALILSGCANLPQGVTMSDEERAACAAEGCSVWTDAELKKLTMAMLQRGFAIGKKDKGMSL